MTVVFLTLVLALIAPGTATEKRDAPENEALSTREEVKLLTKLSFQHFFYIFTGLHSFRFNYCGLQFTQMKILCFIVVPIL